MHKYSYFGMCSFKGRAGFLLAECIIAFAVLSVVLIVIAHTFFTVVHSYAQTTSRLDALRTAQNIAEQAWLDKNNKYDTPEAKISITQAAIKSSIVLPNMPVYKQKKVCVQCDNSNKKICLLVGDLKEK